MDDLIEEILAELPDPVPEGQQFTNLDDQVPPPVRLPADQWVEILNDAKDEFEIDGPLQSSLLGGWKNMTHLTLVTSRLPTARVADVRATQLLAVLSEGDFILRLKFLREKGDDWVLEDKFDSVRIERKKGQGSSRSLGTQSPAF